MLALGQGLGGALQPALGSRHVLLAHVALDGCQPHLGRGAELLGHDLEHVRLQLSLQGAPAELGRDICGWVPCCKVGKQLRGSFSTMLNSVRFRGWLAHHYKATLSCSGLLISCALFTTLEQNLNAGCRSACHGKAGCPLLWSDTQRQ